MAEPVKVGASFALQGSTYREVQVDIDGKSVEQIAAEVEAQAESPSLCHSCSGECEDPSLDEMTSLNIDGTEYVQDDAGGWKVYVPDAEPTPAERLSRVAADLQRFKLEADAALAALDRNLARALAAIQPASPSDTEADDMIRRGRDA